MSFRGGGWEAGSSPSLISLAHLDRSKLSRPYLQDLQAVLMEEIRSSPTIKGTIPLMNHSKTVHNWGFTVDVKKLAAVAVNI